MNDRKNIRVIAEKIELIELCGRGGMGSVYRGHHRFLKKAVAVKLLHRERSDPESTRRFQREAEAASRLDHPNSVLVLDFGEEPSDGLLYLVMEYLDGESLRSIISRGPLEIDRACRIMLQVLAALGAAHAKGVIHRDVKPGNIMIVQREDDEGRAIDFVKVCDFGLARFFGPDTPGAHLTRPGTAIGTPEYMSPEQVLSRDVDARSDIYACGVLFYRLLTGSLPFHDEDTRGLMLQHVGVEFPRMETLRLGISETLEQIVARATAKEPGDRFQSALEMRKEIARHLREANETAPTELFHPAGHDTEVDPPRPEIIALPPEARERQTRVLKGPPPEPATLFAETEKAAFDPRDTLPSPTVKSDAFDARATVKDPSGVQAAVVQRARVRSSFRRRLDTDAEPAEGGPNWRWVAYAVAAGVVLIILDRLFGG